jgi:hypothetical protein
LGKKRETHQKARKNLVIHILIIINTDFGLARFYNEDAKMICTLNDTQKIYWNLKNVVIWFDLIWSDLILFYVWKWSCGFILKYFLFKNVLK